jgi:hypothetical protein
MRTLWNQTTAARVIGLLALFSAGAANAAVLHPIIEIETGYFFGASENGNWIKAFRRRNPSATKLLTRFTA